MPVTDYQHDLFESRSIKSSLVDANIEYWPGFLTTQSATELFGHLLDQTEWRQEQITVYGKTHDAPRLSCWVADSGLDYRYSNMTMSPVAWSSALIALKQRIESLLGVRFNSVLLNYYRNGQDSNGWHSDDEPELGKNPVIASVSLGAVRDFKLRHKSNQQLKHTISLQHGSLLLMSGRTQTCWQHQVPKRVDVGPRINLTFRSIIKSNYATIF